jgi:hypothetical protein
METLEKEIHELNQLQIDISKLGYSNIVKGKNRKIKIGLGLILNDNICNNINSQKLVIEDMISLYTAIKNDSKDIKLIYSTKTI